MYFNDGHSFSWHCVCNTLIFFAHNPITTLTNLIFCMQIVKLLECLFGGAGVVMWPEN